MMMQGHEDRNRFDKLASSSIYAEAAWQLSHFSQSSFDVWTTLTSQTFNAPNISKIHPWTYITALEKGISWRWSWFIESFRGSQTTCLSTERININNHLIKLKCVGDFFLLSIGQGQKATKTKMTNGSLFWCSMCSLGIMKWSRN